VVRSGVAQASYVPDEQIQSLRELARLRARLLADRQDYLRQLIAQLDVVLPEHRAVPGDLLTARARGILAQFPQHLAHASPRAIRRAAEDAGARGFSLDDATGVRDGARRSLYSGKAAAAVRHSGEWRTIYLRKKAQGKTAKQALVVVAVKLLHAAYAMLKHRQPYNRSRLLVAPATIRT
jgi:hypothetical protein